MVNFGYERPAAPIDVIGLEQYPGKKAIMNEVSENISSRLKSILKDINYLVESAAAGNLEERVDEDAYHGDWATGGFR